MAEGDAVALTLGEAGEPGGIHRGDLGRGHQGDVAVDVVAEERRGIRRHAAQLPVREQAALDQRLEAVADAQDKAAAREEVRDGGADLGVVDDVGDELAAAVRLVTGGEAAAEGEDLALGDPLREGVDGPEDILRRQVPEHERTDLGPGLAESLGGVIVAVGAREHRQAHDGMLHRSAGVDEVLRIERDRRYGRDRLVEGGLHPWRIELEIAALIGLFKGFQGHFAAIDLDAGNGHDTELDGAGVVQGSSGLDHGGTIAQGEEFRLRDLDIHAEGVAHRHLHEGFGDAAVGQRPGRNDVAGADFLVQEVPVVFQLLRVGHPVRERGMFQEIDPVAGRLELRRDDAAGVDGRDAEGDEGRGHVDVLEGAAHRVLAADGRKAEFLLHLERAEQGAERFAPGMGILGHALEVFLVGEPHAAVIGAGAGHLGAGFNHGVCGAVVRAPEGEVRVVAESHHARGLGVLVHGQFLDGDLRLSRLPPAAVRHQDGGTADGGVEHLHEALLGSHVRRGHDGQHLLLQRLPCRFLAERILVLDGQDRGLRIVLRAGAVDERAGQVADLRVPVEHPHPAGIGDIGHVGDLDVVHGAEFHHAGLVGRFHDHGHPLLGLADRELRRVQAGVFRGHAVQPDVQAVGQLADGDAHAAGAEVVRFLDEFRHFRTAEEALQLALLGGVTLLDFAAAGFEGGLGVLLGGTGGAADAVPAGTAAQEEDHVAGSGAFAPHGGGADGTHHRADLHALGGVAVGIDFPHVRGCKADLVAVAGVTCGGLLRDHPLGKLARDGVGHGGVHVAGTGDAHRLIHVGTTGERVADGAAEAGRRAAERLDFGRMVMGLVLELEEPFLGLPVHIDIHENAAGVVLLAHLQVVQLALLAQPAGADGRELHQAAGLVPAAEVRPHLLEQVQGGFQFGLHEGLVHRDLLQDGGEGGMAAMVAPVGVQDAEFCLGRIPALGLEVVHHFPEVGRVHRQAVALAEGEVLLRGQVDEARQVLEGLHIGLLAERKDGKVLFAAFHRVDEIVPDLRERLVRDGVLEDHQAGALDLDVRFRVDQMDAVHGGGGPLVELAGNVFHGDVFLAREREVVGDGVRHYFPEHAVAALLQQVVGEAE